MKYKLFTLLELLLVILLIGLLLSSIKQIFTYKQRDFLKANWCVNAIVWDVSNYFYDALTSKWIRIWNTIIYPKKYQIVFSWGKQQVLFRYYSWSSFYNYKVINLTGSDEDTKYWCYSQRYYVYLSWNLSILMQPWLEWWAWKKWILIDNNEWIKTGEVYLKFVWYWYTGKVLGKIVIDKRVDNLYFSKCLIWTGWGTKCKKWSN